ncbi:hypothetical protein SAMN05444392_11311 [Seinonella peptonophila]|uniref:Phosphatidylglycerol lysyltransferase C-terminal domain-containing protein n=1 Tax=Seinonella peptonophila TaxID=112248 RepID=A0A1M5ABE9_9BACL|nr:phosphatidylglycerol lysyltransferase domain-containing protein [Seinonella peptonophila]SHF27583.1 hypothetical protein SAMN05444392_11311 [Seinonella peptonophila]
MGTENNSNKVRLGDWMFNSIDISDKKMFYEYIEKSDYNTNLWSSNFAYLWAISQSKRRNIIWKMVKGMLVTFILRKDNGLNLACLPFGKGNAEQLLSTIYRCLRYCNRWNKHNKIKSIATVRTMNDLQLTYLKEFNEFGRYFTIRSLTGIERHFDVQQLVTLTGKKFKNIRYKLNLFRKRYPQAKVREYHPNDYQALILLSDHWKKTAKNRYSNIFDGVYYREIIKHYSELDHLILVVEIDGQIVGMITGGILPTGQSWGCLIKKMEQFDGLNEMMTIEFARTINKINPNVELMNVGSDLGAPGLQAYKDKYRPVLNLNRYRMALK